MPHVFICGNSGSGESTLAQALVKECGLIHVDLDTVAWTETVGIRRPLAESIQAVTARLGNASAVIEGCYADLIEALIGPHDELIWLDLPVERCITHCRARPFEPHKWPTADDQDAFLPQLLDFVRSYPQRDDPTGRLAHEGVFDRFSGKRREIRPPFDSPPQTNKPMANSTQP